ncbi:MAG: hypothetical protein QXW38_08410 [Candidatus Nitrosotenuis sp.]
MSRLTIKTPRYPYNKWQLSINGKGHIFRKIPGVIFKSVERKLLASSEQPKTHLFVDYGHGYHNGGFYTSAKETLFALQAFLEDYLNPRLRGNKEKRYYPI